MNEPELTITVYNSLCQIRPRLSYDCSIALDEMLAFGVEGAQFSSAYINNQWDGKTHLYKAQKQVFPTGYLPDVMIFFKERGISPVIDNRRGDIAISPEPLTLRGKTPWKHQVEVFNAISQCSRGLIQVSTGGGKTLCEAGTYALINQPGVVLTYRKELMYQLRENIQNFVGEPVGILGDGVWEEGRLTVCMAQSLVKATDTKYARLLREFSEADTKSDKLIASRKAEIWDKIIRPAKLLIVDETHHLGAASSYALAQALENAQWRFGFSATAFGFREDGKDYLIKAAIGDVIKKVTTSDLVDEGILVPTDVIMVDFSHAGHRYPKTTYNEYYYKAVVENDERNKILIQTAYHLYKAGKPVLMAVQRIDHGKILELAMQHLCGKDSAKFVYGDDHSTYRDQTLKDFADRKLPILISTLINEGINIPHLTYTIAGRGEESRIATIQLMGRGMRAFPGKTKAVYVDIMDRKTAWLSKHTTTREIAYNNERAFTTIPVDVKDLGEFLKGYKL